MENKRLFRSQKNSVIGGVCGGLGNYFDTDPIIFRALFVITFFAVGSGILVYIVLWIITPLESVPFFKPADSTAKDEPVKEEFKSENMEDQKKQKNDGSLWGGIILIVLGGIFLIDRFVQDIDFGDLWPLILVAVGVILISKSFQKSKN
jgi:phage shock protein PspC (stress-responsive transcriptional regulator)